MKAKNYKFKNFQIPYTVSYRDVKYPRLEFKTGKLIIILPHGTNPEIILAKHKDWVIKKFEFIKECRKKFNKKKLNMRNTEEFKKLILYLVKETSKELNVELNHIYFKKMRTKWASLSSAKNLTINSFMKYLPENLIRYVIFHELAHIIVKRHNDKFWNIISSAYPEYQSMEKEMLTYWFLILDKTKDGDGAKLC